MTIIIIIIIIIIIKDETNPIWGSDFFRVLQTFNIIIIIVIIIVIIMIMIMISNQ